MKVARSVISNKGLVTLPKEWRDNHNLTEVSEVELLFSKEGGPLIIIPKGFEAGDLQGACIDFLERGLTREQVMEAYNVANNLASSLYDSLQNYDQG